MHLNNKTSPYCILNQCTHDIASEYLDWQHSYSTKWKTMLTICDFWAISSEYWWGMWWITTSFKPRNETMYLQSTLLISIAQVFFRECKTSTEGSNSITGWTSFSCFWGDFASAMGVTTLDNSAYWWVQWRDLFLCSLVWILAWTSKSTLSPTILVKIKFK